MKITKASKDGFDYMKTIKKINQLNGSPNKLSREKIFSSEKQISSKQQKDPIFNEKIPIKVRLIKAAHLNPNFNFTQIKDINKYKNEIKTEENDESKNSKIISVNKHYIKKIKLLSSNKKQKLKEKDNNDNIETDTNDINIRIYKKNYSKKSISNDDNIDNIDFERKTYMTNTSNTSNISNSNYSKKKLKNQYSNNNLLKSEGTGIKKVKGIFSTDNIFSNCENNYYLDKSVNKNESQEKNQKNIDRNIINKLYNIKTFITANNENIKNIKEKINSPISVQTYNNTNSFHITNNNYKYIYLSPKNDTNNLNNDSDNLEIKLEDLILFEEKLNDIYIALNSKNIYEGGASNECIEFINFYFHCSLKNNFAYFFNGMNKVIIKSAINLILYVIIISYHLSLNPAFLNKLNNKLKNIFSLFKLNLYLFIKKIELFYGEKYTKKNDAYFKNFNYILIQNGIFNCNESKIVKMVNKNCYEIVSNIDKILDFYKSNENAYYQDFSNIFSSISKINEIDIYDYFYSHLYINSSIGKPKPIAKTTSNKKNKINNDDMNYSLNTETKNNDYNNSRIRNNNQNEIKSFDDEIKIAFKSKNKEPENNTLYEYEKNKAFPPFLKHKNQKKYTLVLDLEETLVHINQTGDCILRPGLYKFLKGIKPYYELVSFSNESKYSSISIIDIIESENTYFDYNLYREHLTFSGKEFIKDINKLGRDIKKVIIVDNIANNFKLNQDNGIQIYPFFGDVDEDDNVLDELKKILILFYKDKYDDLRIGIKKYKKEILKKITKGNKK